MKNTDKPKKTAIKGTKKDTKKPFWKRLTKSTEKVNIYLLNLIFIFLYSVHGSLLIGIILLLKVNFIKQ